MGSYMLLFSQVLLNVTTQNWLYLTLLPLSLVGWAIKQLINIIQVKNYYLKTMTFLYSILYIGFLSQIITCKTFRVDHFVVLSTVSNANKLVTPFLNKALCLNAMRCALTLP